MSNEEIIKTKEEEYLINLTPMTKQLVFTMLDKAREDEAVGFILFVNQNGYLPALKGVWYKKFGTDEFEQHTTEQLYSLFKSKI